MVNGYDTDFALEQQSIDRRRKLAEALMQSGLQMPQGGMVGRVYVGAHPMQQLAQAVRQFKGSEGMAAADEESRALASRKNQMLAQWLSGQPTATQNAPADGMGPTQTRQPTRQELQVWALKGLPVAPDMAAQMALKYATPEAPIKLGANETLIDPVTRQPIFSNTKPDGLFAKVDPKDFTPKSVAAFSASRNHADLVPVREMKVSNGQVYDPYKVQPGSFITNMNDQVIPDGQGGFKVNPLVLQARMAVANAGATRVQNNVNSYLPASEEAQRDFMKGTRSRYDQLQPAGATLDNIEKAKALVPKAAGFVGSGAETKLAAVKFLNHNLGLNINTEGVKNAEELQSRLFMGIMDNLKKMDSQPSQRQQDLLQRALGQIGTDPAALPAVLDVFGDIVRQKVSAHNDEVRSAIERGVRFPYDPTIKIPEKRSKGGAGGWAYLGKE